MKRFIFSFVFSAALGLLFSTFAFAQNQTFSDANVEYTFDLPDPLWKMTTKPSAASPNVEYTYIDRMDGYLEIRKLSVKNTDTFSEIIQREKDGKWQFKPGYVGGTQDPFSGSLKGTVFNFEFVKFGQTMSARYYYLKSDPTIVYVLRFEGQRDKLRLIRNQVDSIARTFKVKSA